MQILERILKDAQAQSLTATLVRVSTNDRDRLTSNAESNERKLEHRPFVGVVRALGGVEALVAATPTGQELRRNLGLVGIRRSDIHMSVDKPGTRVGYLWHRPEDAELVLLVHDSIAEDNLRLPDDPLPRNAVAELLVQVLMHPAVKAVHVSEWDRLVRSNAHGQRVLSAARAGRCQVYEAGAAVDLYTSGGQVIAAVKSSTAAGNRDDTNRRTQRGVLGRLHRDQVAWPYQTAVLPPGYVVDRGREKDEGKSRRIAVIKADEANAAGWTVFYRAWSSGASSSAAAQLLSQHALPARGARLIGRTYDELDSRQAAGAVRTLTDLRVIQLLRGRRYRATIKLQTPVPPGEKFEGYEVDYSDPRYPLGAIQIDVGLPDHGIDLTDAEWDACEERARARVPRVPAADQPMHLLAAMPSWFDDGCQYRITASGGKSGYYYKLWRRPEADSRDGNDRERGWRNNEGEALLIVPGATLERVLGEAIASATESALCEQAILPTVHRALPDPELEAARRQAQLAALEEQLAEALEDVDAARDALRVRSTSRRQEALEAAEAVTAGLTGALQRLHDSAPTPDAAIEAETEIDVSTVAALAGLLMSSDGATWPRKANDAVQTVLRGSLRLAPSPSAGMLHDLTGIVHLDTADGDTVAIPFRTSVPGITQGREHPTGPRRAELGQAVLRLVLHEGHSIDQACEVLRRRRAPSVAAAVRSLREFLPRLTQAQACVLLDCPVEDTKSVIWAMINGSPPPPHLDPAFVQLIQTTYVPGRGWNWTQSWARSAGALRRLLAAFDSGSGDPLPGMALKPLSDTVGLGRSAVCRMARAIGTSAEYPRLLEHDPDDPALLRPRQCPKCRSPLTHVLVVPELQSSDYLVCASCRSTADGILLPAGYADRWDGPAGRHRLAEGPGSRLLEADDLGASPIARNPRPDDELLRIGAAAALIGVKTDVLRQWADRGELPCTLRSKQRRFRASDLLAVAARIQEEAGVEHEASVGGSWGEDYLTVRQAADRLRVGAGSLRDLARSTPWDQSPLPYRRATASLTGWLLFSINDLDGLDPEWVDAHSVDRIYLGPAAKLAGVSQSTLREALHRGEIPHVRTRGTARILPADVIAWADRRRAKKRRRRPAAPMSQDGTPDREDAD